MPNGMETNKFKQMMIIFLIILIVLFIFINYMLYRNEKVYKFRINLLEKDYEDRSFNQNRYYKLPSYDYMLFKKFWIWPLSKFIKD